MQSTQCCCTADDPKLVVPKPLSRYQIIENVTHNEIDRHFNGVVIFRDHSATCDAVPTRSEPDIPSLTPCLEVVSPSCH